MNLKTSAPLATSILRGRTCVWNAPNYSYIQRFSRQLASHGADMLLCFKCLYVAPIAAIYYKTAGVATTLCRVVRPAQIRVPQTAPKILGPGNDGESVTRKSLFKVRAHLRDRDPLLARMARSREVDT
jgi:hypothetical protein